MTAPPHLAGRERRQGRQGARRLDAMTYQDGVWVPQKHTCRQNHSTVKVETYMQGVREAWLLCEQTEWDDDDNVIVYDVKYCPYCGKKLEK